jgi:hypothetical protein
LNFNINSEELSNELILEQNPSKQLKILSQKMRVIGNHIITTDTEFINSR